MKWASAAVDTWQIGDLSLARKLLILYNVLSDDHTHSQNINVSVNADRIAHMYKNNIVVSKSRSEDIFSYN